MGERKSHAGFSLYAGPPTPPARRYFLPQREYIDNSAPSSVASNSTSSEPGWSSDDSLPPWPPQTPPDLLPAPLNIRKYRYSTSSSNSGQTSPCRKRGSSVRKRASYRNSIVYPPANLKRMSRNRSPTRVQRTESKLSKRLSRIMLLNHGSKRDIATSTSTSQWFDVEEGLVDRRKLSIYLGNVLGSSFQIPHLDHAAEIGTEPVTLDNVYGSSIKNGPLNSNPPSPHCVSRPVTAMKCECAPDKVLCQGKSSPEFNMFTRWPVLRKSQLSVSSTACQIQIPRGRSEATPPKPRTPTKPKSPKKLKTPPKLSSPVKLSSPPKPRSPPLRELALSCSPPDLVHDNPLHSDDLDWSMLRSSPQETDVFRPSPYITTQATPFIQDALASTKTKRYSSAPIPKSQPPSSYKPNKTIMRPQSPTANITAHSSLSSLEFDFDYDSKRHFQQAPSIERHRISRQILHRHLRSTNPDQPMDEPLNPPSLFPSQSSARVASYALGLSAKTIMITQRTSSTPIAISYDRNTDNAEDGRLQCQTRVQIRRPPSNVHLPKRGSALIDPRASQPRTRVGYEEMKHSERIHQRASSRTVPDESPVLGKARLVFIN